MFGWDLCWPDPAIKYFSGDNKNVRMLRFLLESTLADNGEYWRILENAGECWSMNLSA